MHQPQDRFGDRITVLAHKTSLDFEAVETNGGSASLDGSGYGGLLWSNVAVIDGRSEFGDDAPSCGYITGITSGKQVMFNGAGQPCTIAADGTFDLKSIALTAVWDRKLQIDAFGYRDGQQLYHTTLRVTDTGPSLARLNFDGVDEVRFKSSNGVEDPRQPHTGMQFAADDLVIRNLIHDAAPQASERMPALFADTGARAFTHDAAGVAAIGHADLHHLLAIG